MFGEIVLGPPLLSEPGEWFFDKNYLVYFMYILSSTNEKYMTTPGLNGWRQTDFDDCVYLK